MANGAIRAARGLYEKCKGDWFCSAANSGLDQARHANFEHCRFSNSHGPAFTDPEGTGIRPAGIFQDHRARVDIVATPASIVRRGVGSITLHGLHIHKATKNGLASLNISPFRV